VTDKPIVFTTTHRVRFSELDIYEHVSTAYYGTYYVDHRMQALRERFGWDFAAIAALPFMVWVKRMEIDFIRPVAAEQEITITSFVRSFEGPYAAIECGMRDTSGQELSRCVMTVVHVDKVTLRPSPWRPEEMAPFFE
jgi:acyl-CoA thioester hydrolase